MKKDGGIRMSEIELNKASTVMDVRHWAFTISEFDLCIYISKGSSSLKEGTIRRT